MIIYTADKVSVFGVILVRIFPMRKMWTRITPHTDTFHSVLEWILKEHVFEKVINLFGKLTMDQFA